MSLPRNSKSRTFLAGLAVLCLQLAGISGASAQSSYPQFIDTGHPAADSAAYNAALEQYDQQKASGAALQRTRPVLQAPRDASRPPAGARQTAAQSCLIPRDASWTRLAVGDDNSSTVIPLGFTFNLYGVAYNSVFVNNNGNLTFTSAYSSFSSTGFPFAGMPMVAPFWADVDTRGNSPVGCGGGVYYKNFGTRFVVTWEAVGYYSGQCDKKNTFQVVISDGADPVVGLGQNVKFNYGDMNWTTGSASGGSAGFGGTPATAGVNKGTGGNFIQTGRFGFAGTAYDGGGGATDGVDYLDYECYSFNVSNADNIPPSFSGLPNGNTLTLGCGETATLTVSALGPEVNQYVTNSVDLNGLCGATASVSGGQAPGAPSTATVQITASSCNIGTHTIEFSATDNGTPSRTSTVTVTVIVTGPEMPVISGPSETCPAGTVTLTASGGSAYRWNSGDSSASINVHPGTYSVQSIAGGCASAPASFVVASADHSAPVPVQATLPVLNGECSVTATAPQATDDCSGLINATSNDPLSYTAQGTYTIHWTYTDATGNSTQQEQTVIVKDNTPPVIACAFNVTVNAAANSCGAVVNYNAPSATDNCGSGSLPTSIPGYTYKGTFGGHTYFLSNSVTTPEDAHARAIALGGHLVTISNAQENAFVSAMNPAFIWIGHTDRAVEGDFRWVTSEPVTYTNWNGGEPNNAGGNEDWAVINWGPNGTWNDWFYSENALYVVEFEGGNIPTHLVSGLGSGANFPIGTTTETWEAVDAGGNRAVCSFTVTVVDAQAPTVICPANRSINLQSNCTVAMPDYRGLLQASDNCNGALNIVQSPAPGTLLSGTGALFVNFTVRDAANNSAFCSFRLTKRDVTRPVLNVPANVTVTAPSGTCSIAASAVALGEATATDTCSMATVTRNPLPDQFPVGSTPVYYTAVDASGNGTQGVQIVTVLSMDAPVLAATPAITTSNDAGTCGAFVDVATPKATAFCANNECRSENMDGFTAGDISGQSPYFTPWPGGFGGTVSSDYAFSAPNSMRLANDQDQLYLLGDKTSGKWELTWKMYVPEGRFAYFNSQKFAGSIGTEFGHEVRFFSNGTGSARTPAATTTFSFPHGAWFEVRHSYDLDANTATLYINGNAVQTWTLSDRIGAVNGPGSKQLGAIDFYAGNNPDDLAAPEYYIDDIRFCGSNDAIVSGARSDSAPLTAAYPVGTTTITWTATGGNGQQASATQAITVQDTEAPVVTAPVVASVYCHASSYHVPAATFSDNCGIASVTYSISGATTRSGNGADASGAFNVGTSTVTWTVTDVHGNSSTASASVRVNAPVSGSVADVWAVRPGGQPNTIYQGYGPATVTLTVTPAGGTAPYTYQWSNGATSASTAVGAGTWTVVVRDAFGCVSAVITKVIGTVDVRCGNKMDKVLVCHNTGSGSNPWVQVCVAPAAVGTQLANGGYLGTCGGNAVTRQQPRTEPAIEAALSAYPNPSRGIVQLRVSGLQGKLHVEVLDSRGSRLLQRDQNISYKNEDLTLDLQTAAAGLYTVRVSDGTTVLSTRIVIAR